MQTAQSHFLQPWLQGVAPWLYVQTYWWTMVGFVGNILFGSRFIFQWLASEKRKQLVVPNHFWWLSFWGSLINLIYALHIDNAPIIFGVIALPFIYGRNIILMKRTPKHHKASEETENQISQPGAQNYQTVQA